VTVTRSDSSARLLAAAGITPEANEPKLDAPPETKLDAPPPAASPSGNGDHPPGPGTTTPPAAPGKPEGMS
jgi:hypothetical protein